MITAIIGGIAGNYEDRLYDGMVMMSHMDFGKK